MSQCSKSNTGTRDDPSFGPNFPLEDDDVYTVSVASCTTEDTDEFPPFSPEGLISWMFERCNRRFEDALASGNNTRAHAHNQRRTGLADFMNFIGAANDAERDQTTEMLNTIDDLSSHERSPTKDMDEAEETRATRVRISHAAMITLQSTMAMQLQGCSPFFTSSSLTDGSWFSFAFLMIWTLLLAGYSWYMLRNMNQLSSVQVPQMPDTLNLTAEPPVTHEATSIEGLVTWTLGNIGSCMRYAQIQRWL